MLTEEAVVAAARGWIGTPYRHQGSRRGIGCDCLGLVRGLWRDLYGPERERVPAYTPDWAEAHRTETLAEAARRHFMEIEPDEARAGDVVLFRWRDGLPAKHAGVLVASDRMVHAQSGSGVAEVSLCGWWRRRMAYAFRFPGVG